MSTNLCLICSKQTTLCCSECKCVFYCSQEHQKAHWDIHKKECIPYIKKQSNTQKQKIQFLNETSQKSNNKSLKSERTKNRFELFQILKFRHDCIEKGQDLVAKLHKSCELSYKGICNLNEKYEYLADLLLCAKYLIQINQIQNSADYLDFIFNQLNSLDTQSLQGKNSEENNQRSALYGSVGFLFDSIGYSKQAESAYVKLVEFVEFSCGNSSLEVGDSLYCIGEFYLKNKSFIKALACFKKCQIIRLEKVEEKNEFVLDCEYKIAVIYKKIGQTNKAIQLFQQNLIQTKNYFGQNHEKVAKIYQIIGKINLEKENIKQAFFNLKQSYQIIEQLSKKHPHNKQFIKVSLQILKLYKLNQRNIQLERQNNTQQKQKEDKQELFYRSETEIINEFQEEENEESMEQSSHFQQKSERIFIKIDEKLSKILSLEQLYLLTMLNKDIQYKKQHQSDVKVIVLESDFVKSVKQSEFQYKLLKDLNPECFTEDK